MTKICHLPFVSYYNVLYRSIPFGDLHVGKDIIMGKVVRSEALFSKKFFWHFPINFIEFKRCIFKLIGYLLLKCNQKFLLKNTQFAKKNMYFLLWKVAVYALKLMLFIIDNFIYKSIFILSNFYSTFPYNVLFSLLPCISGFVNLSYLKTKAIYGNIVY
jgi:hypothetical protein